MGLSRTVSEIRRFQSKITKFFHPLLFCIPDEEVPWNWVPAVGVKKTRVMGLPGRQISLTISSAVWIECTNVDGRTDTGPQQRTRLRIALHGKSGAADITVFFKK